jgi:nucleoside-diphosphate-sugar epimerase
MIVVVTGGAGFLARALRRRLRDDGAQVIAVDRAPDPDDGALHVSDLSDPATLLPTPLPAGGLSLVHLAWATDKPAAFADHAAHVRIFAALLDHWESRGLRRVVFAGSAEEYGAREGRLREDDDQGPAVSPYGWGKRAAFDLLRTWSARSGVPALCLRPFVVYGPGQRGNMMLPYALRQAVSGEVARFSDGQQLRDFVYVDDVAAAFAAAVSAPCEGVQAVNVGMGEGVRVADVIEHLASLVQPRPAFQLGAIARRAGEPAVQFADMGAAASILGWRATTHWRDGLKRTVAATLPPERRTP